MFIKFILFAFIFLFAYCNGEDCVWNKDTDFPGSPPLLIDLNTWVSLKAVDDGGQRLVKVTEGASIVVACSGSTISSLGAEVAEGVCVGGEFLEIGGNQYTIEDLECSASVQDGILENQGSCGDGSIGELAFIGFDVPGYQFYPVIRVCFEKGNQISLYSEDIIYGESVTAGDGNPSKPSFRDDDYFYPTVDPDDCYSTTTQDEFFTDLLGDPDFIDPDHSIFFSRGHLAPNADFLNDMEADASYYYINAVPQWQPFNGGNWMYLEGDARDLASKHGSDLHIFTGPWENLILPDVNNNPTTIFLCDSQSQSIIPIPSLVWKVIYEESSDRGVAVITNNNPEASTSLDPICPDVGCDLITWLTFTPSESDKGFTYCCTVQDLKDAVPHAPDLPSAGLLTD